MSILAPPVGRAVRLVFENDPFGRELGADAVSLGKAAFASRRRPCGDLRIDSRIDHTRGRCERTLAGECRTAAQPRGRIVFQQAHQPAAGRERALQCRALTTGGRLMGLLENDPPAWLRGGATFAGEGSLTATASVVNPRIDSQIAARAAARRERRFAEADRIRAELAAEGVILEDKPDGTTDWWRKD